MFINEKNISMKHFRFLKSFILILVTTFLSILIVYCILRIDDYSSYRKKNNEFLDEFKSDVEEDKEDLDESLYNPTKDKNDLYYNYVDYPFLSVDFSDLLSVNDEIVGWIRVSGTSVDYPVVQAKDNTFYLDHYYDKSFGYSGSIFSDFRNNLRSLNYNSVIYGHGRLDKTMFGSIRFGMDEEWFSNKDNYIIYLSTPYYNYIFLIFSVYVVNNENYYITTHFHNNE